MAFELYTDKSSLDVKDSRLVMGGTTTKTGIFLGYWEKKEIPREPDTDITFSVTNDYAYRADKIAYKLYGRSDLEWIILQYNNIIDIMEELKSGVVLTVPSADRAINNLTGT